MAQFWLISWDIAIDKKGIPTLVEVNIRNGDFSIHQFNNGPLFGDLTDLVLNVVLCRNS